MGKEMKFDKKSLFANMEGCNRAVQMILDNHTVPCVLHQYLTEMKKEIQICSSVVVRDAKKLYNIVLEKLYQLKTKYHRPLKIYFNHSSPYWEAYRFNSMEIRAILSCCCGIPKMPIQKFQRTFVEFSDISGKEDWGQFAPDTLALNRYLLLGHDGANRKASKSTVERSRSLPAGYYPYTGVLGHEFVGRVSDPNAPEYLRNQIVVGEINAACENCEFCLRKIPTQCANRTVLGIINRHGCFAEYLTLPAKNLHIVPGEVSVKEACFVEPLAAAFQIQEQICIKPGQKVLVVGDGKLGLLIGQSQIHAPGDLLVHGQQKEKLKILDKFGVKTTLNPADIQPCSFDIAIECTGNPAGFELALKSLKPRGILVMKSTYADKMTMSSEPIVVKELTLIGSRCGPFPVAIEALKKKNVDVLPLLAAEFPIEKALEAFEFAKHPGVLKVQIVF